MKGISRRARACAAVAVTGVAVLASAGSVYASPEDHSADGAPTGQGSVQLFNYGGFINNGGGVTGGSPGASKTLAELGTSIANDSTVSPSTSCATATSSECRWNRLEALFAFLAKKG